MIAAFADSDQTQARDLISDGAGAARHSRLLLLQQNKKLHLFLS